MVDKQNVDIFDSDVIMPYLSEENEVWTIHKHISTPVS